MLCSCVMVYFNGGMLLLVEVVGSLDWFGIGFDVGVVLLLVCGCVYSVV